MNEDNNTIKPYLDNDDAAIDFKALFAALLKHKLAYILSLAVLQSLAWLSLFPSHPIIRAR